jgi:hypothetical protein
MPLEPRYPHWMNADEVVVARVGEFDITRTETGTFITDRQVSHSVLFFLGEDNLAMRMRMSPEELDQLHAVAALLNL